MENQDAILDAVSFIADNNHEDRVTEHVKVIAETLRMTVAGFKAGMFTWLGAAVAITNLFMYMYVAGYKDASKKDLVFVVREEEEGK